MKATFYFCRQRSGDKQSARFWEVAACRFVIYAGRPVLMFNDITNAAIGSVCRRNQDRMCTWLEGGGGVTLRNWPLVTKGSGWS
jgi:hypothetical protein